MRKGAKYILYGVLGLAALIAWGASGEIGKIFGRIAVENYQEGKKLGAVEKAAEEAARELRKQLPIQVDEITTLQNVISVGARIIYNYRISLGTSDLNNDEFVAKMTATLKYNVCKNKKMKSTLDLGGSYAYVYTNFDGLLIGEIEITSSDCIL